MKPTSIARALTRGGRAGLGIFCFSKNRSELGELQFSCNQCWDDWTCAQLNVSDSAQLWSVTVFV